MPVVEVKVLEGHSSEKKRKMIQEVSKSVAESLDIPLDWVQVIITEVSKDNWGLKGEQVSRLKD